MEILVTLLHGYSGLEGEVRVGVRLLAQSLERTVDRPRYVIKLEALTLGLVRHADRPLSRKTGRWAFLPATSELISEGITCCELFVCYSLWAS